MRAITLNPARRPQPGGENFAIHSAFILLFPGFFFYQTLLGLGLISAVLGGYFTLVALALTPPLMLSYHIAARRNGYRFSALDRYCMACMIYYLMTLAINSAAGANSVIAERYVQSIIFCIDTYIIFRLADLKDAKFVALVTMSLVVMSAITIHFSIDGFFYLQGLGQSKDPDSVATYQGFARSYLYTFLIVISVTSSMSTRFLFYGIAILSLFLNGARSEFVAVLFAVPVVELYHTRYKLASIIPIIVVLTLFGMNMEGIVATLPDNRTLQLLDLSHSSSAVARQHLSGEAWHTITENPLFGDFASYQDGHYAHNILTAWVDFGLVGFLSFAVLMLWPAAWLLASGFFSKARSPEFVMAFSLSSIAILWALTAKNVPDMSVGAALGAFARYRHGKKT